MSNTTQKFRPKNVENHTLKDLLLRAKMEADQLRKLKISKCLDLAIYLEENLQT